MLAVPSVPDLMTYGTDFRRLDPAAAETSGHDRANL